MKKYPSTIAVFNRRVLTSIGFLMCLAVVGIIAFETVAINNPVAFPQMVRPTGMINQADPVSYFATSNNRLIGFTPFTGEQVVDIPLSGLSPGDSLIGMYPTPNEAVLNSVVIRENGTTQSVEINAVTGVITPTGEITPALPPAPVYYGMDFFKDLRLVSTEGLNLGVNQTGLTASYVPLAYVSGDPGFGRPLHLAHIASVSNPLNPDESTIYGINVSNATLVRIGGVNGVPSANEGRVTTIGSLGINITGPEGGFDIDPNTGQGYAMLPVGGITQFVNIDVIAGTVTNISPVSGNPTIVGMAIAPAPVFPCQAPSFSPPTNYSIGPVPLSSAAGDFNGDGVIDLASIATSPPSLVVRFGEGNGLFGPPVQYQLANSGPRMIVARDLDGDGDTDLAVSLVSSNSVAVYKNNGTGVFAPPINFPAGQGPGALAVGDVDGDGDLDLVAANLNGNTASVLLNDGAGSFGAPVSFSVGTVPRSVAIDDFNNDGKPDLITANQNSNDVSLLLNNGTGFAPAVSFPAGTFAVHVSSGDLNEDGNTDIAVMNQTTNNITMMLGNGMGGFGAPVNFTAGTSPGFGAIRDVNSDGHLDLLVANQISHTMSVLPGIGNGSFRPPTHIQTGQRPVSIIPVDLNTDGRPDVITTNVTDSNFSVLFNNCVGQEPAGTLRFASPVQTVKEGKVVSVAVDRISGSAGAVSCTFALTDQTATGGPSCSSGVDYIDPGPIPVNFEEAVIRRTVDIQICPDSITEPDETFAVSLTNSTGGATIGSPSTATIKIEDVGTPLNGTIEVGPDGDYDCLTNNGCLFEDLNERGCSGDVGIKITANLTGETGAHTLQNPGDCGVSIQPAGGEARHIAGSSSTALLAFDGVDLCSIDGLNTGGNSLTISNTSTEGSTLLLNEVSDCTIDNTTIEGATQNPDNAVVNVEGGSDVSITNSTIGGTEGFPAELALRSDQTDRFTMFVNDFSKSKKGLHLSELKNTLVNNNTIVGGPAATGLALAILLDTSLIGNVPSESNITSGRDISGFNDAEIETNIISGNRISGFRSDGSVTGIQVIGNTGSTIVENNKIYDLDGVGSGPGGEIIGINIRGSSTSQPQTIVRNNMVSLSPMNASNQTVIGIQDAGRAGNIFTSEHNSVYIGGSAAGNSSSWAFLRDGEAPTSHTARNNIGYNGRTGTGNHYAVGDHSPNTGTFVSQSNFFAGSGSASGNHFDLGSTAVGFTAWQAGPPARDADSDSFESGLLLVENYFVNVLTGDLHILSSAAGVIGKGMAAGVMTDFDLDPRPTNAPDRGADQLISESATVSGQALAPDGRGVRNATVSITDPQGVVRKVTTNALGFYSFSNVKTRETHTIRAVSKRFRFQSVNRTVMFDLTNVDLIGIE